MVPSRKRICIVGAGSWGTTLAIVGLRAGREVSLYSRDPDTADRVRSTRKHERALSGIAIPDGIFVTADLEEACRDAAAIFLVVPSQSMRETSRRVARFVGDAVVVSATKGLELSSLKRMTEVITAEIGGEAAGRVCALSGPNIANEIAAGLPATSVVASTNLTVAEEVRDLIMTPQFRCYSHGDVVGVEMGGALKNIIAIGAGLADGLDAGENAKAAFITRGVAEVARLGVAAGANPLTFAGLSGLGDLIATCASRFSRNRHVGEELAKGRTLRRIESTMEHVAEGVFTTRAARELGERLGVQMPITDQMHAILFDGKAPAVAIAELMRREPKHELEPTG